MSLMVKVQRSDCEKVQGLVMVIIVIYNYFTLTLSVGQEVQRVSVISNLPSLVRQNPAETFRRVVPKVRVRIW